MTRNPDIEAKITFIATADGGKMHSILSGYRPTHNFGIPNTLSDAQHNYPDVQEVRPGETVRALMTLLVPDYQKKRLFEGMIFTAQEGNRVVGQGTITKVINDQLKR